MRVLRAASDWPLSIALVSFVGSMLLARIPVGASDSPRVPLPTQPERLVSLSLPADEVLLEITEHVVALEPFVDDPLASNAIGSASRVPRRVTMKIEDILELTPDLVIVPEWADPSVVALLHLQHVPTLPFRSATSLAEIRASIADLADAIGEREHGRTLIEEMDRRLAAVACRAASRPTAEVALVSANRNSPAGGTLFCEIASIAGAECALAERGLEGDVPLPIEELLALDPEVIFSSEYIADGRAVELVPRTPITSDRRFASLRAVQERRVFALPSRHVLSTSHHIAALAEDIERALHGVSGDE